MAVIFCSACGAESPEDVGFCAECGTALFSTKASVEPTEQPPTDPPTVTPKKKFTFQVVPALIFFGVVIALTFGFALIDEPFNCGVKKELGIDLAGLLDASKSAAYYCK